MKYDTLFQDVKEENNVRQLIAKMLGTLGSAGDFLLPEQVSKQEFTESAIPVPFLLLLNEYILKYFFHSQHGIQDKCFKYSILVEMSVLFHIYRFYKNLNEVSSKDG